MGLTEKAYKEAHKHDSVTQVLPEWRAQNPTEYCEKLVERMGNCEKLCLNVFSQGVCKPPTSTVHVRPKTSNISLLFSTCKCSPQRVACCKASKSAFRRKRKRLRTIVIQLIKAYGWFWCSISLVYVRYSALLLFIIIDMELCSPNHLAFYNNLWVRPTRLYYDPFHQQTNKQKDKWHQ